MGDLQQSYATALNIWINRFAQAQGVIRELEDENEALRRKVTELEKQMKQMKEWFRCQR